MLRTLSLCCLLALAGCVSVPTDYPREESYRMPLDDESPLGRFAEDWRTSHPEESGFQTLGRGLDGLGARLRALDLAQHSVDAQYFLIKPDEAGQLFLGKLLRAADRGVRVRLLVDDVFTPRRDQVLATLSSHHNIEIRLFNPLSRQSPVFWSLLWDFQRSNRRMHNKSFIVDGSVAIVGGRNIAAEYFELKDDGNFDDFEVLAAGPIVDEIARSFDEFWNSRLSLPVEALGRAPDDQQLDLWREIMTEVINGERSSAYGRAISSELLDDLFSGRRTLIAASARVVSDRPEKLKVARGTQEELIVGAALADVVQNAQREVTVITPYFLLQEPGRELLKAKAAEGVRIRVITNSLASTNHVPVHAHYRKYRRELLEAGVELYELRADRQPGSDDKDRERMTLHTKAFELDGETLGLGSVNLDPRSLEINSELVIFIDSPQLSRRLLSFLESDLPQLTWRLELNEDNRLRWHYQSGDVEEVRSGEPGASLWRRLQANLYRLLPIEGQL
ncbi:MAG: phospholipase D family protein [Halieaceae bacterium]|jgi:putative cardiolipin synthase|nr:phospholipase D family protein [Halieaceae bacterium]